MSLNRRRVLALGLAPTIFTLACLHLTWRRQMLARLGKNTHVITNTTSSSLIRSTVPPNSVDITRVFVRNFSNPTGETIDMKLCPEEPPLLRGKLEVSFQNTAKFPTNWPPTFEEIAIKYRKVELGGYYPGPGNCSARQTIAVIVPFRDREEHLRFFLHYIHLILQRQQTRYLIFVVEQNDNKVFNKGQLMNAGFLYAINNTTVTFDCIFFHDVDTISEDDRTLYRCKGGKDVVHLAHRIDRYNYRFCCGVTVGGVVGFTKEQFQKVNGFSNMFNGWGGEDDDINARIKHVGKMNIFRPRQEFSRFKVISHQRDDRNPENPKRFMLLNSWRERQPRDGINTLKAHISKVVKYVTHTRIYVSVILQ